MIDLIPLHIICMLTIDLIPLHIICMLTIDLIHHLYVND